MLNYEQAMKYIIPLYRGAFDDYNDETRDCSDHAHAYGFMRAIEYTMGYIYNKRASQVQHELERSIKMERDVK